MSSSYLQQFSDCLTTVICRMPNIGNPAACFLLILTRMSGQCLFLEMQEVVTPLDKNA